MKYRYRESHEMKDSGVEWLGMIPKEWEVKAHKYIMYKKKEICNVYSKENILSLTKKGVIVRDLENPSGKMPTTFDGYQKVYKNNLLLCLFDIDVTPRCVGVIKENGLTSPAYSQFIVKNGNVNYYNYLLNKIDDEKSFLHLSKNLRNSLTEENFGIIKTIKPKVLEQQKIADFLDKKCEEFDSVIAKKEMLINKLEEAKKSLISEVVTGKVKVIEKENGEYGIIKREAHEMKDSGVEWLGMIPKEWEVSRLKYHAMVMGGFAFSSNDFEEDGIQIIKISNLYMNELQLDRQPNYISKNSLDKFKNYIVTEGDILISLTGTLGKRDYGYAIFIKTKDIFLLNQRVGKITCKNTLFKEYLITLLHSGVPSGKRGITTLRIFLTIDAPFIFNVFRPFFIQKFSQVI